MSGNATNRKTRKSTTDDMRPEYDFSGAVRGKYYKRYQECTNVVGLEPDVARRFKTAAAVNDALRAAGIDPSLRGEEWKVADPRRSSPRLSRRGNGAARRLMRP